MLFLFAQVSGGFTPLMYHGVIALLISALIVMGGLWVRAHDHHRQWSTEKLNEHERSLALLQKDFEDVRADVHEIKDLLKEHFAHDVKIHSALVRKLDLEISD